MQITCPDCKKTYVLNPQKIPPNITSAKCKACGHSIPLRSDPAKKMSADTNVCRVTCLYCSRKYAFERSKIRPDVSTLKCKACGHSISLKQAHADTKIPQDPGSKITCLYCSKTYTIDRNKIPEGVTTTKCKSCGHAISLSPKHSTILPPKKAFETSGAYLNPPNIAKLVQSDSRTPATPSAPLWKKPWLLAAVLAMIVLGVTVLYTGVHFTKFIGGGASKDQAASLRSQWHASKLPKPFMRIHLNVPLTLSALDQRIPEEKKDANYTKTVSTINALNLKYMQLYLFPHSGHTVLPVAILVSNKPKSLEAKIKKSIAIHAKLDRMPDGSYRLKKDAIPNNTQNGFPVDLYRVHFWNHGAVICPKSFLSGLQNPEILQHTLVSQMAASIEKPDDLATVSVRIPENLDSGWEKKIDEIPAMKQNPQLAMAAAIGGSILAKMTKPLGKIETMTLGFRFNDDGTRNLNYAQKFRNEVNGEEIYQDLGSGDSDDFDVDGIVLNLIELFQNPAYQHQIQFEDNKLALEFSWAEEDDEVFLSELSKATIGQLFAQSMQLEPSAGTISTQYTDAPEITTAVNVDQLKQKIPETVKQCLFPGNYFETGDEPQMSLTLDTVDIPNAALAELTYDVLAIKTTNGKNVLRAQEDQFKFKIKPGSATPGHITLPVQKGIPAQDLATAKIRFNLLLPYELEQIEFNAGEARGRLKKAKGVHVKLDRLEKDVAKVEYRGGRDIRLFAFDKTGQALASRESMSSASSVSARFQGVIAKLKVVVVKERIDYPFEIDIDLNGGKQLELSHMPENPKHMRYDRSPIINYATFTKDALDDLAVVWKEGGEMSWNDGLAIPLPKSPISGEVDWEVHFFAEKSPLYLAGNSFFSTTEVSYRLQDDALKQAHAAFGSVHLNLASDIERLRFEKGEDGKPLMKRLSTGKEIAVSFYKNEITLAAGKADIIQNMAFDAQGRRLKRDGYTRHKDGKLMLYFWGTPANFEMDIAVQKVAKMIHFDIRKRPVQEEAYLSFQINAENQGEVVKTLRAIADARRKNRTGYGDDVAGLYYIYDRKKKAPMKLITKTIAHSDPAGQKRFGYTLKPYKGYYFTVLTGTESNGVKQDYPRQSKEKTYAWHKGTFKTLPYIQAPDIVAIPVDTSQPTFFLQWSQVYMKQLNGSPFEYLPTDYYSQDWVEAKFIEG